MSDKESIKLDIELLLAEQNIGHLCGYHSIFSYLGKAQTVCS